MKFFCNPAADEGKDRQREEERKLSSLFFFLILSILSILFCFSIRQSLLIRGVPVLLLRALRVPKSTLHTDQLG